MIIFRSSCALVIIVTMALALVAYFRDGNVELMLGLVGVAGLAFAALVLDRLETEIRALRHVVRRLTDKREDESGDQDGVGTPTAIG